MFNLSLFNAFSWLYGVYCFLEVYMKWSPPFIILYWRILLSTLLSMLKLIILLKWCLPVFSIVRLIIFFFWYHICSKWSSSRGHTSINMFVCLFLINDRGPSLSLCCGHCHHAQAIGHNWTDRSLPERMAKEIWFLLTQSPNTKCLNHTEVGRTTNKNLTVVSYDCSKILENKQL